MCAKSSSKEESRIRLKEIDLEGDKMLFQFWAAILITAGIGWILKTRTDVGSSGACILALWFISGLAINLAFLFILPLIWKTGRGLWSITSFLTHMVMIFLLLYAIIGNVDSFFSVILGLSLGGCFAYIFRFQRKREKIRKWLDVEENDEYSDF